MGDTAVKIVGKLRYRRKSLIGQGNGTNVYRGKYEENIDVAIKRVQIEAAKVEIDVLQKHHSHRNVVKYYTTETDEDFNYIATELCQNTLEDFVSGKYKGEDVGSKHEILKQITEGLEYLHDGGVVHRDIKPQNILISPRHDSVPPLMKLADFGISRILKDDQTDITKTGSSGTLGWIAPEFYDVSIKKYKEEADIFPLGCVFCYVLSDGIHPFGNEKDLRQGNIKKGDYQLPEELDQFDGAKELIISMLNANPKERPTAKQVLKHRFFDAIRPEPMSSSPQKTQFEKGQEIRRLFNESLRESSLGKGSFNTTVCKVLYKKDMRAIKRIEKEYNDSYINEKMILSNDELNNPHVVRYYDYEEDTDYYYIIMELCDKTLAECVVSNEFKLIDSKLLKQIALGLEHLHEIGIVHRDIKPTNVLVKMNRNDSYLLKLADFGISKKLIREKDVTLKRRGSTGWMAPELFATPAEYTKAVDIFAAGLVIFYTATKGNHPFYAEDSTDGDATVTARGDNFDYEVCQENIRKNTPTNLKFIEENNRTLHKLIESMIQSDVDKRPRIIDVKKHPYFWTPEEALDFICKISNHICLSSAKQHFVTELEKNRTQLLDTDDWTELLTPNVKKHLNVKRGKHLYKGNSVEDLIRTIRNKYWHWGGLHDEEKEEFGLTPEKIWDYWSSRFPSLLIFTWQAWECQAERPTPLEDETINKRSDQEQNILPENSIVSGEESDSMQDMTEQLEALNIDNQEQPSPPTERRLPVPVSDCAWNPIKNDLLASVSLDSKTCLWNTSAYPLVNKIFEDVSTKSLLAVTWKRDGNVFATGNSVGDVIFWKCDGTQLYQLNNIMESFVLRLEFHPSRDLLLAVTSKQFRLWPSLGEEYNNHWICANNRFSTIYYGSFHKREPVVAVCGRVTGSIPDFAIDIFKINGSKITLLRQINSAHNGEINEVKWQLGEGKLLASCSAEHEAKKEENKKKKNQRVDYSVKGSVKIWLDGNQVHTCSHDLPVTTVEWCPIRFNLLASTSVDGKIFLWDTNSGTCLQSINNAHQQTIKTLAFSPDGGMLASGGNDNRIKVWKLQNDNMIQYQSNETGCAVNKVCWNCAASPKLGGALNDGRVIFFSP